MGERLVRIRRGIRNHPGTLPLIVFAIAGAMAAEAWWGALISLAGYGPLYLWGAYERGKT